MKSLEIKIVVTAIFICFRLSSSQAQTEPRLVLPIGHTGEILSAEFSPDNKYVITASRDHTSRIFEVFSGKEVHLFNGHEGIVRSAVFSADGQYTLTSSDDGTARICEMSTGKELHVLAGHYDGVNMANFSPNGKYVITASADKTARIFEVSSGKLIQSLLGHRGALNSARFSNNGKTIITASSDSTSRMYDLFSGRELFVFDGFKDILWNAAFSSDDKMILVASNDGTIKIYDTESGQELNVISGNNNNFCASFSPDNLKVLTTGLDRVVRMYELESGSEIQSFSGHSGHVNSALFSADGSKVITSCSDRISRVFDVSTGNLMQELHGHLDGVNSAVFSSNCKLALTCSEDNTARIFDLVTGKEIKCLTGTSRYIRSSIFSPDSRSAVFSAGFTTYLLDLYSGNLVRKFKGHEDFILSTSLSSNGELVLTGSYDKTARIYQVASGEEIQILKGHTAAINAVEFNQDGTLVATACRDKYVRIFQVQSGLEFQKLEFGNSWVQSISFSPDNKLIVAAGRDKNARVYFVDSGLEFQILKGHDDWVESAVFSPDGKCVLTAGRDGTARIFETKTGELQKVIYCDKDGVSEALFSPDGSLILLATTHSVIIYDYKTNLELQRIEFGHDWVDSIKFNLSGKLFLIAAGKMLYLYDGSNGKQISTLIAHDFYVHMADFSPNEKFIISSGGDHKTILWDVATGKPLYTRLQLKDNDWLVYDEHYRFDGTPGAIEKLYFVCELEPIELGQMKDALYVPGLASKIINGEDINYKKLSDLDICGALPLIEKIKEANEGWEFSIEKRRWDITRLEIKVDGKTVKTILPDQLKFVNGKAIVRITRLEMRPFLIAGEANSISLVAITENDHQEFISRGVQLELEAEGDKQAPNFYMLMIGVNDYKDDALDLRFPVQDARAFGSALESSARKLLGNDKVFVYNVQSKTDNTAVFTTPERAGVMKALEDIGKKAKTNDVLFIFFAGHGVMQGADNTFTFLTADASKLNPVGVSTQDLKLWLSPEGSFHMMPNKTVLVYDACNSGQASKELADLAMARDDNATERQRQIEDLGDKSGVFILSASAPNQSAYELPHLGQGMLTYSLLTTLKNNPGVLDESQNGNGFLNLQKWFLETEREQSRLMQSLGLNQEAQPYGTANIRIGIVDDEVREGINLMAEKPLVYCSSARDDSEEDPLELKQSVNAFLETATSRGTNNKLGYIKAETSQANILKLVYSKNGDSVECRILIFKNKVKINELNIITTVEKAAEEVVKAVEEIVK